MTQTAAEITLAFQSGAQSADETVRACLDRIARWDGDLGAFLHVCADDALARAKELDAARRRGETDGPASGSLAGVPVAIKDNISTRGVPTTCGSRLLADFRPLYNAHVVERLQASGAIVIGKTNLDEFGMGSSTEHSALHRTRNPWNAERVPGGSSGGSAAAVAARMVPVALGSDTGGSIRQPASMCGVVGLKPSYGRVSRYGLVAYASSLEQVGCTTTTVADAAVVLQAIAGHDARGTTSAPSPVPDYPSLLDEPPRPLRIGVPEGGFADGVEPDVARAVDGAVALLAADGAEVVPLRLPHVRYAVACYYLIAMAEASSNLARFDGVRYGRRATDPRDVLDMYTRSRGEGLGTEVKRRIMLGTYALSSGYYDAFYLKASKVRTLIRRDFDEAFEQVDVIATPVAPGVAFRLGERVEDPLAMYLGDLFTIPANLAGFCAISVPCGLDGDGLPIGLQLAAPAFREAALLSVAHAYQQCTRFHLARPAARNGCAPSDACSQRGAPGGSDGAS
jgi:aspartyl-tRNA(Asn)/glutamyl-tRNA(Gln) amidotransferase subunit A